MGSALRAEIVLGVAEEARRRLITRCAWRWAGRVAVAWFDLLLALVLLGAVVPLEMPVDVVAAGGLGAAVLTALIVRAARRPSRMLAAQVLDLRGRSQDRVATAVEILSGAHRMGPLAEAVVEDAARWTAARDLRADLPVRPGWSVWAAAALAVMTLLADRALVGVTVPGTPAREVIRTIQREGRRLERAGETLEDRARADLAPAARRVAPTMRRLGAELQRQRQRRAEALSRIEALAREVSSERSRVQARRAQAESRPPSAGPQLPQALFRQRSATERALRQFREIADQLAEGRSPEERQAMARRLAALAEGGPDGDVPVRAREQAARARERVEAGDAAGARRAVQQGAADLEEMRAILADEEGLLQAQRDLQRAADRIARGVGGPSGESEEMPQAAAQPGRAAPGSRPLPRGQGTEEAPPPAGPHQGTAAGQGASAEKLGERAPRLEGERVPRRLRGLPAEGRVTTSEVLGPGRPGQARAVAGAAAAARADADRYMARMRVPPEYRDVVRRYFEALAAIR